MRPTHRGKSDGGDGVLGEMANRQQQPIGPAWGPQRGLVVDEITRATGGSGIKKISRADGVAAEDEELCSNKGADALDERSRSAPRVLTATKRKHAQQIRKRHRIRGAREVTG